MLDRLLDFEPENSSEAPKSRSASLRDLKLTVRRDVEWLLNTRRTIAEVPTRLEETVRSVFLYGLPDFVSVSAKSPSEQKRLTKELETAIRLFEPRLIDVRVTLEPTDSVERVLRFRIEAKINVEPVPEPVVFDTVLQLGSGEYKLKER